MITGIKSRIKNTEFRDAVIAKLRAAEGLAETCGFILECPGLENLGAGLAEDLLLVCEAYHKAGGGE
jgi:hypothetical protein